MQDHFYLFIFNTETLVDMFDVGVFFIFQRRYPLVLPDEGLVGVVCDRVPSLHETTKLWLVDIHDVTALVFVLVFFYFFCCFGYNWIGILHDQN